MERKMEIEEIRALPKAALAKKYNCTVQYIRKMLQGKYQVSSERSQKIMKDIEDIIKIIERKTDLD